MYTVRHDEMVKTLEDQTWDVAADNVRKLRFLAKLKEQVEQLEERLFDGFKNSYAHYYKLVNQVKRLHRISAGLQRVLI